MIFSKRVWVQRPGVYWAVEHHTDGPLFSRSWLAMMEPPFFHGRGVRIRQRGTAFHIGLCRKAKKPFVRPVDNSPEEIGKWVY